MSFSEIYNGVVYDTEELFKHKSNWEQVGRKLLGRSFNTFHEFYEVLKKELK